MADELKVSQGLDGTWTITLRDAADQPVTTYAGTETLALEVWAGDDRAAATTTNSTIAWLSAAAGTLALRLHRTDTALLAPGRYKLLVKLTDAGVIVPAYEATLLVSATAGAATVGAVYATADDLRRECGWIDSVSSAEDQAGYQERLEDARTWFDDLLHAHFPAGGAGLSYRAESAWVRSGTLKSRWLIDALAADQLLVTRAIRRACALYALGQVLKGKVGAKDKTSYQVLGARYEAQAEDLAATIRAEIDTDADGYGDVAIDLGSVVVLRG